MMLRVTILNANFSKNVIILDPFKKFTFNISKKFLFCQPCLFTNTCLTAQNSHATTFPPPGHFANTPPQVISFSKQGQELIDSNDFKYFYKRRDSRKFGDVLKGRNGEFVMLSIKGCLLCKLTDFHPIKHPPQQQPTLKHPSHNFTHTSTPESLTKRCEGGSYNCEGGKRDEGMSGGDKSTQDDKQPGLETLLTVQEHLNENMPRLLSEKHDYSIYHKEVEFVNNWSNEQPYTTIGTMQYRLELAKLKLYIHVRMTQIKVILLRTTVDQSDASVKVRWRISGIPHATTLRQLFDGSPDNDDSQDEWLDGFSTFYVASDGLIWKHVMDKISPEGSPAKEGLIEKLARRMSPLSS